jgi:5-methylcytosine-specific restriction enzyme subunit McrC
MSLTTSSVNERVIKEYDTIERPIDKLTKETVESLSKYLDFTFVNSNEYIITARSYIGVIKLRRDFILHILPKIELNNLFMMLNYVYDIPIIIDEEVSLQESNQLIKFLIRIFIDKVQDLIKKNYRKSYVTIQENRMTAKGRVLIYENFKANRFHLEKIFCEFDDYTDDILINRVIKYTIYILFNLDDGEFSRKLRYIFSLFKNVTLKNISVEDVDSIRYSRLNEVYKPVHLLCRLFIQNIFVSHKVGEQRMFSFLLDMNQLFEKFVRGIFNKFSMYRILSYPRQKYLDETDLVKIIPDIRFSKGSQVYLVTDCKYKKMKKLEDDSNNAQIINSDIYQMLAYMVGYQQDKGLLIYPKGEVEEDTQIKVLVDGVSKQIFIKPIDLNTIDESYLQAFSNEVENIIAN